MRSLVAPSSQASEGGARASIVSLRVRPQGAHLRGRRATAKGRRGGNGPHGRHEYTMIRDNKNKIHIYLDYIRIALKGNVGRGSVRGDGVRCPRPNNLSSPLPFRVTVVNLTQTSLTWLTAISSIFVKR